MMFKGVNQSLEPPIKCRNCFISLGRVTVHFMQVLYVSSVLEISITVTPAGYGKFTRHNEILKTRD